MYNTTKKMNPTAPTPAPKLTYADYCLIPEDGNRHEIIDGDHYVSPAPTYYHQQIILRLGTKLFTFVDERKLGSISLAPVDVVLSDHSVVQPDLLFISAARASIITPKNVLGTPDLLIEVLSEFNRRQDEVVKRSLYEKHGVAEYWVVDPELELVKIYYLKDGKYDKPLMLMRDNGDTLTTDLLPGFECGLDKVFIRQADYQKM